MKVRPITPFVALAWILTILACFPAAGHAKAMPGAKTLGPDFKRVVCLGDSITEGFTYPLRAALCMKAAGWQPPLFLDAGVGGDTAPKMLARLGPDVLDRKPTLVMLSVGVNDSATDSPEVYAGNVRAILDRLDARHIKVMLLTTTILGPKYPDREARLRQYNDILRRMAHDRGYYIGDVYKAQDMARAAGRTMNWDDNIHMLSDGYQAYTRAVLDGMGLKSVPLLETYRYPTFPGTIGEWRIRPIQDSALLAPAAAAAVKPDPTWTTVTVPETKIFDNWWQDQIRAMGYVTRIGDIVGPGAHYQACAKVYSPKARTAWLNLNEGVRAAYLNGALLPLPAAPAHFRPGSSKVRISLQKGENVLLLETGDQFYAGITDTFYVI